jgi:hypothetical protein
MPSVAALRAPLLFGGVPAILAQFGQVAQSFAAANSFSALSKLHSGLPERAVTDIVCYRPTEWTEYS